jgi:hypothetical protein
MAYLSSLQDWQAPHQPGYAALMIHSVTNFCGLLRGAFDIPSRMQPHRWTVMSTGLAKEPTVALAT